MKSHRSSAPRPRRLLVAILAAACLTSGAVTTGSSAEAAGPSQWFGTVTAVEDGDTFNITLDGGAEQRVRLAGVNTNEVNLPVSCLAIPARDRLRELILGKRIRLEAQNANSSALGRPIRHAFVGNVNVGELMVREGWGVPLVFPDEFDYAADYVNAFWDAQADGVGISRTDACGRGPAAGHSIDLVAQGDASGSDTENLNGEWVRIRNTGTTSLDLSGWWLKDTALDYYAFPSGTVVQPDASVTVHVGTGTDSKNELFMGLQRPVFSGVDGAFLLDPDGDIRAFDMWPCRGRCGDRAPSALRIAEVMYDVPGVNDDLQPNGEWVRITNTGSSPEDLRDWRIETYPYSVDSSARRIIGPGESVKVFSGTGSPTADKMYFGQTSSILNNEGDVVLLVSPDGDVVDCFSWGSSTCRRHPATDAADVVDFNGDGWGDTVTLAPGESIGAATSAGAVYVRLARGLAIAKDLGQNHVLGARHDVYVSQAGAFPGTPERNDRFGSSFAVGDFDRDGYDDLAVGAPGEAIGSVVRAGAVMVVMGDRDGLSPDRTQLWSQQGAIAGAAEPDDEFGAALAAGDFDGDGFDDLAIGVPGENRGAGIVVIVPGSASGLREGRSVARSQSAFQGSSEAGDRFGAALAVGDVDGDGFDDLLVGAPGEAIGSRSGAGAANLVYGGSNGLGSASMFVSQAGALPGAPESDDRFGSALSVGDVDADGFDDLLVGVPGEDVGARTDAGLVHLLWGAATGPNAERGVVLAQGGTLSGSAEAGDLVGSSVAVVPSGQRSSPMIAIGAPGEAIGDRRGAGAVHLLQPAGRRVDAVQRFLSQSGSLPGASEPGDALGASLTWNDHDGDGRASIVIGAPGEDLSGVRDTGMVHVVHSWSASGAVAGTTWTQRTLGAWSEPDDRLGS